MRSHDHDIMRYILMWRGLAICIMLIPYFKGKFCGILLNICIKLHMWYMIQLKLTMGCHYFNV